MGIRNISRQTLVLNDTYQGEPIRLAPSEEYRPTDTWDIDVEAQGCKTPMARWVLGFVTGAALTFAISVGVSGEALEATGETTATTSELRR